MRLFACLVPLLAGVLVGCGTDQAANGPANDVQDDITRTNVIDPPPQQTISKPLSRRNLLLAASEATSDFAAGVDDTERQRALDGQPFSLVLRLCEADSGGAMFRSSLDKESRVLRLEVRPDIDASSPLVQQISPPAIEAVEGFWLRRPWLLDPACPTRTPAASAIPGPSSRAANGPSTATMREQAGPRPEAQPQVGIAEFHDQTSDRSNRRGNRPYEITKRLAAGALVGPLDLVIEGRLRALTTGKVIVCSGGSAMTPPSCIISVRVDAVSLRQPGGDVLGEWRGS